MPRRRRDYPKITWSDSKQAFRCTLPVNGKRRDVYGKTEDEVMDKVDALDDDMAQGIDRTMTLMEYSSRWGAIKMSGLKPKSREVYKNVLKNHILPRLGALPLCEIKPLHVDELLASMDGKSSSLRSKVLYTLSQIFENAIENDLIQKSPCRNKKAGGEKTKIKTPLTKEQQNTLCEGVEGTRAELFVLLCLYAGLRREEVLGLLWGDVHLDVGAPYIDVRHTVTFDSVGRPTHSEALKSGAAYRSIPVPPRLFEALKRKRAKAGSVFVVPSVNTGGEMSLSAFRRMWGIAAKSVPFHIEPHLLRHTYITELCASGLDIKKIQYLAGHATAQMTLDIYAHVTQNRPEQLAPAIIAAFSAGKSAGNGSDNSPESKKEKPCIH